MPKKVVHRVTDIVKWTNRFASMQATRMLHGVPNSVFEIDPNDTKKVTVTHTVTDENKQKAFRQSQEGKDNRTKSTADDGQVQ